MPPLASRHASPASADGASPRMSPTTALTPSALSGPGDTASPASEAAASLIAASCGTRIRGRPERDRDQDREVGDTAGPIRQGGQQLAVALVRRRRRAAPSARPRRGWKSASRSSGAAPSGEDGAPVGPSARSKTSLLASTAGSHKERLTAPQPLALQELAHQAERQVALQRGPGHQGGHAARRSPAPRRRTLRAGSSSPSREGLDCDDQPSPRATAATARSVAAS